MESNDGRALELLVAEVLKRQGKRKVGTRMDITYRSDGHLLVHNYDVVFYDHGLGPVRWGLHVAEVKCYTSSKVPEVDINHYLGKLQDNRIEPANALFYTISDYTRKARARAKLAGLTLLNGNELERDYHTAFGTDPKLEGMLKKLCSAETLIREKSASARKVSRFTKGATLADRFLAARIGSLIKRKQKFEEKISRYRDKHNIPKIEQMIMEGKK